MFSIHLLFELLAYGLGAFLSWRVFSPPKPYIGNENIRYAYYTVALTGAFLGAFVLGTLNTYYSLYPHAHALVIGKSILGAIAGATLFIEVFKKIMQLPTSSTGAYFVPSLAIGIVIGRIGCFLSGLDDYTYGVETRFVLGYDFGDGIARHPVQLYESLSMALFFIYTLWLYTNKRDYFEEFIFYQFILIYTVQRFVWEFLKPYEPIIWRLNVFQIVCVILILYALYKIKRTKEQ